MECDTRVFYYSDEVVHGRQMAINPKKKRTRLVIFRMDPAEYKEIEGAAACSRSVSDWIREELLRVCRAKDKAAFKALEVEHG